MRSNPFSKTLTRRNLLSGSAALAAATFLPNPAAFALRPHLLERLGLNAFAGGGGAAQPTPPNDITPTTVNLAVASNTTGTINPRFVGLSCEKTQLTNGYLTGTNTDLIALCKLLGPSILRIGGNNGDSLLWETGTTPITQTDITNLASFLTNTGWTCIYTINLAGSAPGQSPQQTPTLAGAEAAYVVSQLSSSLLGFEIGNEPDVYNDNGPYAGIFNYVGTTDSTTTNGKTTYHYQGLWKTYHDAITSAISTATFTGPASGSHEGGANNGSENWTQEFATNYSSNIKLLTQHYYRPQDANKNEDGEAAVAAWLVSPDSQLATDLTNLHTDTDSKVSFRISECNNFAGGGVGGVSDAYASAIWAIDFMFQCAGGHATGVNFHGGGDAEGTYSPITDHNVDGVRQVKAVQPEFYGLYMVSQAIQQAEGATCKLYSSTLDPCNATAYAVQVPPTALTPNGAINIVVDSKDASDWLQVEVTLPYAVSSGSVIQMTQPSNTLTDSTTYIQGAPINIDGTWDPTNTSYTISASGTTASFYVPPLSAVLAQLPLTSKI